MTFLWNHNPLESLEARFFTKLPQKESKIYFPREKVQQIRKSLPKDLSFSVNEINSKLSE